MRERGIIFNVERYCLHDGPGVRTVVFLKGCPLRCFWCQNPEGLNRKREIQFIVRNCIMCRTCASVCPTNAHQFVEDRHIFLRERCIDCGRCVESCPAGALQYTGREVSVEGVVEEVLQDKDYYDLSKGGVTLSGGEPLMQPEFSKAVLEGCKLMSIHTAIETSLFAPWESVEMVLPYVDLIMFDIKHIESSVHKRVTGVSNELILENARKLLFEAKVPLIVRTPIVPTVNDSSEVVVKIAEFIRGSSNLEYYELLPFHKLGQSKYQNLGLEYPAKDLERPSKEKMLELARAAEGVGVKVRVGRV